jgi:hypothetical protein
MKHLEFTDPTDRPQSTPIKLGIAMDTESGLAIGLLAGDGSYFPAGNAGTIGLTSEECL